MSKSVRNVCFVALFVLGAWLLWSVRVTSENRASSSWNAHKAAPPSGAPAQPSPRLPVAHAGGALEDGSSSAGAVTTPAGRLLLGPAVGPAGKRSAQIPELEEALGVEGLDEAWTRKVLADARRVMPPDAEVRELAVRCAHTFCRVKISKPLKTQQGWREIDKALTSIAPESEAVFNTEADGALSTGYLYFSAEDAHLPLGNLEADDEQGT